MPLNVCVLITGLGCLHVYIEKVVTRLFMRYCDLLTQTTGMQEEQRYAQIVLYKGKHMFYLTLALH